MANAALPTPYLRVALVTNPMDVPTWTDLSAYLSVEGFSTRRGRDMELGSISVGSGLFNLKNEDRRFDPTYTSGPYYGNLKRMRRTQFGATWDGVDYDILGGYVERWPLISESLGKVVRVPLPVLDGFAVLSSAKLNASFVEELSGARVNNVLTAVNWGAGQAWVMDSAAYSVLGTTTILSPVGDRTVGEGNSTMQAGTVADTYALAHLQDVENSEQGLLFMGKSGDVVFHGRHRRYKPPYSISVCTFGDGGGTELPYSSLQVDDDTPLWNDVRLTRSGGSEQSASDPTSQGEYYVRTYQQSGLLVTTDLEVADQANWRLYRYKEPGTRIKSIELKPGRDPSTMWPVVLGLEIGDRVTVKRRPPGGGNVMTQESWVEGIGHSRRGGEWTVTLSLSPADSQSYWLLDDTTCSVLGTTTRLGY